MSKDRDTLLLPEAEIKEKTNQDTPYCLILCNDEVNSFEHVIKSLIDICKHDMIQAEQCAYIAHFNGECDVKIGNKQMIEKLRKQMSNRGLTTEIEKL